MEYEWYADIFFMMNFLMDVTGILTAAVCCNVQIRMKKMFFICGVSILISILLLVYAPGYLLYRLLVHMVVNPAMTALIFKPRSWGQFLRLLLAVYLVFFVMGGVQEWIQFQTGSSNYIQILLSGIFAATAYLIYMQRRKTMQYVCTVDLWLGEEKVTVDAYCDSGNLLCNPDSGKPISILEQETIKKWNTKDLEMKKVPYHTISEEQAYLDVITLDKMDIYMKGTTRQIKAPEIGLRAAQIMRHPPVQMLLHSSYMSS